VRNRTEVGLIAARHNLRLVDDDEGGDEVESAVAAG
jgi:hypothetical protein